jgi:hypothetical protein
MTIVGQIAQPGWGVTGEGVGPLEATPLADDGSIPHTSPTSHLKGSESAPLLQFAASGYPSWLDDELVPETYTELSGWLVNKYLAESKVVEKCCGGKKG